MRKLQGAKDRELAALKTAHDATLADLNAKLAKAEQTISEQETQIKRLADEAETLRLQAQEARDNHAKVVANAMKPAPEDTPVSWAEALQRCGNDHALTVKRFPELHQRTLGRTKKG